MPNPFNSETGQQNKTGGSGFKEKPRGSTPSGSLKMKTANWPKIPGKTGPNRNTTNVKEIKQHPTSVGI